MQFVRQSKYRHIYAKPLKSEFCLQDVRITKISVESKFCAINRKFLAIICEGSGGPFMVFPVNKTGRLEKDYPFVDAHRAPCLDLAWCPFNDNVIASCSEDSTAKVWLIPEKGVVKNITEPIVELVGHQKRVHTVQWHPTAGGDHKILLWNVGNGDALIELAGHPDVIWSVAFNWNGSKIVTTCKDKKIRVIDPRSGAIIQQGQGHEGMKPQQAIFMKDGKIFTTGFTRRSERMYALRDETAIDEPIVQEELDTSNGVLFPLYDADTGLVYLCGKGDCAIRFYEVNDEAPFVHYINTHTTSEPQRGLAFMPKLGLNIGENEIDRVYRCTNKGYVDVLQFYVPRKSDLFQDDLYPDTPGPKPAISADDWMSGQDADPILVTVTPTDSVEAKPKATAAKKANILMDLTGGGGSSEPTKTEPAKPAASSSARAATTLQVQAPAAAKSEPKPSPPAANNNPARPRDDVAAASGFVLVDRTPDPENIREAERRIERATKAAEAAKLATVGDMAQKASGGGASESEQRRWAERLERVNNNLASGGTANEEAKPHSYEPHASPITPGTRTSTEETNGNAVNGQNLSGMEALLDDVHKLKLIVRKHERRIRYLEEQLADVQQKDLDGL